MDRDAMFLPDKDRVIVRDILDHVLPESATVLVFGSRATGRVKRSSDLDLAIDAGRPLTQLEAFSLADAFEESDLSYKVDVIDLNAVSATMAERIRSGGIAFR
jgi:uncharacterized protein